MDICDPDQIIQYQELLATHRRTLVHLLQQAAQHGGVVFAPPMTANGITEARAGIQRCKDALRSWGVSVDDQPDDIALPAAFPTSLDQRNRAAMLQKVRDTWVTGLLERSLYGAALIALGMETRPDAVSHPWTTIVQFPDQPPCQLPAGMPIAQVFDDLRGELLILGAPGSGKTTLLLELARTLLDRADADRSRPMPVVFHLSTWAAERLPLAEWLVVELRQRYDVPQKLAQAWIDADMVLPLLDGLDEVQSEYRDACVDAINSFRAEYGLLSLVVCSRLADYEALTSKLRLRGAVQLQPLTTEQVDGYLEETGDQLAGLRLALVDDPALQELAESPLLLNVMMLAYQGQPVVALADLAIREDRIRHLFAAYVQRMLARPRSGGQMVQARICHWLAWLARRMIRHSQSVFYIECLQPVWLESGGYRRAYWLVSGLVGVLVGGLLGGFGGALIGELVGGVAFEVVFGLSGMFGGVLVGVVICLDSIKLVETLHWSWQVFWVDLRWNLFSALISGLAIGVIIGLVVGLYFGFASGLGFGLVGGVAGGLVTGLVSGLLSGFITSEVDTRVRPNQGVRRSMQSALITGVVFGVIYGVISELSSRAIDGLGGRIISELRGGAIDGLGGGVISGLSGGVIGGLGGGVISGLSGGVIGGLGSGLLQGGAASIQHLILRVLLWRSGALPWNVAAFLDEAAERILLRKVGGGYIFIHRLLLEYFAGLEDAEDGSDGESSSKVVVQG